MKLQRIKMIVSAAWMFVTLGLAVTIGVNGPLLLLVAALCLLPPLALLLWWNEPAQTMAEAIDEV